MSSTEPTERRRPRWPIVAGTIALVVAVGSLALLWRAADREELLLVGDSVSFLSIERIDSAVGQVRVVPVVEPGYTSTDLLPLVQDEVAEQEDRGEPKALAVLLVGYNDVIQGQADAPALDALFELSTGYECAVWLTLPTTSPGAPGALDPAGAARWNDRLAELAAGHGHVHLEDGWAEAVDASGSEELLWPDGLHPNEEGERRLADVIGRSVDESCRAGT